MAFFKKKKKFPFADSENVAVFTCAHVLEEQAPILTVAHDEDGYWQFLCGQEHAESESRVVALHEIVELDESVADLSKLDYGQRAWRENAKSQWNF